MSASKGLMQAASGVSTGGGAGNAWDVSTAQWLAEDVNYFNHIAQDNSVQAVSFKTDGSKMYLLGLTNDTVREYDLSTAWDVSTASYLQGFDIQSEENNSRAMFFKPDGTKMYIAGTGGNSVNEYDLSTAWDISSATFNQIFSVSTQESDPQSVFFKPDGAKMYVCGSIGDDVNEYNLSTAWDISSASFSQSFSVSAQETDPEGVFFKSDGTKMYIIGNQDAVHEYTLSTAWNVSSASFSQEFDLSSQGTGPRGIFFKPDGSRMYITMLSPLRAVYQYDLSTAWDVSSSSFSEISSRYFDFSSQEDTPNDLFFKSDGTKMYFCGAAGDAVYEYDLSTAWDISSASYNQNFSVSSQDVGPVGLFFKPDGLKMYVMGSENDAVYEYDLSTAWDVSSASFNQNFSVSSQETFPQGLFFKPDGTKMYVVGGADDDVNEYDLSTAWDVSSASFNQNFNVSSQETSPQGLFFKPDGLKIYFCGATGDAVYEYDLSTAWDISSASYLQNFDVSSQETSPQGLFFKPDGLKMYVIGNSTDAIYEYDL